MLTSYWTANTVKDMLKKLPYGEPSSTQANESDLATVMTDNVDLGATVMSSPTTSPPRSPRNQRRDQESEAGFEILNDLVEGGEEREDPQPNPGGDVADPGVDDAVRDRLYEWMEENIAAPLPTSTSSYDGSTDSTSLDKTSVSPASSVGAPTNSSRTNWPASCARASLCVPHWTSVSQTHMAWYVVTLEECEGLALQKQFKEAADLVVNAVPLNLVRPFGVGPHGWLMIESEEFMKLMTMTMWTTCSK